MQNVGQLVDRLYGVFTPIYGRWMEWAPSDLHLWHSTKARGAAAIVEEDLRTVGEFFAQVDMIGARTEYTLVAECMALIRLHAQGTTITPALLENEIDQACRRMELERKSAHARQHYGDGEFEAPISWRITRHLAGASRCSPMLVEEVHRIFVDLAHLFLLRDGNITPEEDEGWARFIKAFE